VKVNAVNASSTITLLDTSGLPTQVILTASGAPGTTYKIQASDNGGSAWSQLGTATTAANGVLTYTDTAPNSPTRLYRLAQ
jgi:5-hydroxyisourate hydrolase-like protein (transthyretin family)